LDKWNFETKGKINSVSLSGVQLDCCRTVELLGEVSRSVTVGCGVTK
jgi:hypothetical protein